MDPRHSKTALGILLAFFVSALAGCGASVSIKAGGNQGLPAVDAAFALGGQAGGLGNGAPNGGADGAANGPANPGQPGDALNPAGPALAGLSPLLGGADRSQAADTAANGLADNRAVNTGSQPSSEAGKRIADIAGTYVNRSFDYAPATNNGRLGCAQVVSTILREAGAMSQVRLGVLDVLSDLRGSGWADVSPPPWQDGDVVTWSTYDRDGDGQKDPDTHIGIIRMIDGTPYAVNNSSSQRMPVQRELASLPWRWNHVLRQS